jgi:PKD repeat protein/KaiC/GvpD/RAD55 family RecA-like ATPase
MIATQVQTMPRHVSRVFTLSIAFLLAVSFLAVFINNEASASTTVTYTIQSSEDDAWSKSDTVGPDDVSFYLSKSDMKAGVRWQINIPKGSTIESAHIEVRARAISLSGPKCKIQVFDQDSTAPFDVIFWNWPVVSSPTSWNLPPFIIGEWYSSPELKNMVQTYVDRVGYQSGNYIGFCLSYQSGVELGHEVWAWDGDSQSAAKLEITYTPSTPEHPVASFTYSPSDPLVGETVNFDASASYSPSGSITQYAWNFGDGTAQVIETDPIASHNYTTAGTFNATLTVTDSNSLTNSTSREIVVSEPVQSPPVADFSFLPEHPLVDEVVVFDGSASYDVDGSIVNYSWDFGDGTLGTGITVEHSFDSFGTYSVTLLVTDNDDNTGQTSQPISVIKNPIASFSYAPAEPVESELVTFDASDSTPEGDVISTFSWDFGDGSSKTVTSPTTTHAFAVAGDYTVTLTVTDSEGLTNTTARDITVFPSTPLQSPPVADFSFLPEHPLVDEVVVFDGSASYDVDGSIVNYSWDFGDGTTAIGILVNHSFSNYGTYLVTLQVTDNDSMTAETSKYVLVIKNPIASFVHSPAYPIVGQLVTFDASGSVPEGGTVSSFSWDFGDGSSKIETSPTTVHAFSIPSSYVVILTVTDSEGLSDTVTRNVTVVVTPVIPPIASFTVSPGAMANASVVFDATSSYDTDGYIVDYLWDFGDGNQTQATTAVISHSYLLPGNYSVTLTVRDDDDISNSVTAQLKVTAFPVSVFTFVPLSPLIGEFVAFDGSQSVANSQGISLYIWNFGDGNITSVTTPFVFHRYQTYGSYQVTLSVTNTDGLNDAESKTVMVYAKPVVSFASSPSNPLAGQEILFDAQLCYDLDGTITSYSWNFGDGNITMTSAPTIYHTYSSYGNYIVVLTVLDDDGYSNSASRSVQIAGGLEPPVNPPEEDVHDVSVLSIHVSQTTIQIGQTVNVTLTVKNDGTSPESFNVTLCYGSMEIGKQEVQNLGSGASAALTFLWNTSGFSIGTNTITATADAVPNETNLANNMGDGSNVELLAADTPGNVPQNSSDNGFSSQLNFSDAFPYIIAGVVAAVCPILFFAVKRKKNGGGKAGFSFIDKMFGGGIPAGSTILVLGSPGAGKSSLCQNLAHRFLDEGKACVFVSYDEPPGDVRKRMESFGWTLASFEQSNAFSFVDCYSQVAKVTSQERHYVDQPFSLTDLSITISTATDEVKTDHAKVVFLDSATSLFTKLDIQRVIRFLQDRSAKIKAIGGIFIFTLGKETIAANFANRLEEVVDGIIELDFIDAKGKRRRRIRVKKLRGQSHLDQWVTFTINSKEGLVFLPHVHT